MKKSILFALATASVMALAGCGGNNQSSGTKIAMITDYGDITDQSFNQATYEGCKEWADANKYDFKYFKPASNSDDMRIAKVDEAVGDGYNVVVMPGYAFAPTIEATATKYPDVKFIALDVAKGDLLQAHFKGYDYNPDNSKWASYTLPSNVYCAVYHEEIAGYFAGYAAVKEGYTHLGFLGGMAVPAVVRYGYGFVQGANAAADGAAISINYVYGGQFFGDADITAKMNTWFNADTEVVFSCGGGIYTSAGEAAKAYNDKAGKIERRIIGVDVDQKATIDGAYGAGVTLTSAMKGLKATVLTQLDKTVKQNKFESKIENLGLVSATDVESNYVQLPTATWSMKNFKVEDYKALVADIYNGKVNVSADTSAMPTVASTTTINDQGNIK